MDDPSPKIAAAAVLLALAVMLARPPGSRHGPALRSVLRSTGPTRSIWTADPTRGLRGRVALGPVRRRTDHGPPPTTDEIAASMVLLAVALHSGCGVVEAVEAVAEVGSDAATSQLAVVAAAWRWGISDHEAWSVVDPRWSRVALSLRLAARSGVAPSSLLVEGADDLWSARLAELDVAAARVAVRLVLPLGVAFLPAFVLTTVVPVVLALVRQVLTS